MSPFLLLPVRVRQLSCRCFQTHLLSWALGTTPGATWSCPTPTPSLPVSCWILPRKHPSSHPFRLSREQLLPALNRSPLCRQCFKYRSDPLIHLLLQTLPNQVLILALAQAQVPASSPAAPIPAFQLLPHGPAGSFLDSVLYWGHCISPPHPTPFTWLAFTFLKVFDETSAPPGSLIDPLTPWPTGEGNGNLV